MTQNKKERVLHTRVPDVLDKELKRLATTLKVPVSNVVRTILEDAVEAVDSVGRVAEDEIRGVANRLRKHRPKRKEASDAGQPAPTPPQQPPLADIVGYQPMLIARDETCKLCGRAIAAGEQAYLGIREVEGPRVILGKECLPFSAAGEETKS